MSGSGWTWTPNKGGLIAGVSPQLVADQVPGIVVPDGAHAVSPLHITCLSSSSMAFVVHKLDPSTLLAQLPPLPPPEFVPTVFQATRAADPEDDGPDCDQPRCTGFLALSDASQARHRAVLAEAVRIIDQQCRAAGFGPFSHPEPDRFFHVSVWNNRGGDPRRSIGSICAKDTETLA